MDMGKESMHYLFGFHAFLEKIHAQDAKKYYIYLYCNLTDLADELVYYHFRQLWFFDNSLLDRKKSHGSAKPLAGIEENWLVR